MKRSFLAVALTVAAFTLSTNNVNGQEYGGTVLNNDIMMPVDFASLSMNNSFGTARSMAMGGAFTSLGGDIASIGINPAGLGMFTREVVSFTPMLSTASAETLSSPSWQGNDKTSFSFSNMGATFDLGQYSSGSLVSLTGAVAYSRLADYNTHMSYSSERLYDPATNNFVASVVDVFGMQLAGSGILPASDGSMDFDNNPYYWPAQSAYKTYMLDYDNGWTSNVIGHNASILSSYDVAQSGRTDEYSFAIAGNVGNYLYFGATLGIQEITQTTKYTYQEEYGYFADGDGGYAYASASDTDPLATQAGYTNIWQKTTLSGAGTNLKVGLIARPTRALRVGVSYHSPTYYSLARTYTLEAASRIYGNYDDEEPDVTYTTVSPTFIDNYEYSWRFRTPSKLLLGASYQVGNVGVVSVDYERQWYNKIRVSNAPGDLSSSDYAAAFSTNFRAVNTLRAGLEIKPTPVVSLRVGGGTSSSMVVDESLFYSSPTPTDSYYVTCGVGFQFSANTTLDIGYQYYHQNYSSYYHFYAIEGDSTVYSSNLFDSSLDRNFISATLTFKI